MFEEIDKKLIKNMNNEALTQEKMAQLFDKKEKLPKRNKMGEELFLYRHRHSDEIVPGQFSNQANYYVINDSGQVCGKIDATVANVKAANQVEVEYWQIEEHRNKGNVSIALEGVLNDIFVNKALNGLPIKLGRISNIQMVFLAINPNNLASQKVAEKTGFTQANEDTYILTLAEYLSRIKSTNVKTSDEGPQIC